jgi:lysophospholipase L1-like esterase
MMKGCTIGVSLARLAVLSAYLFVCGCENNGGDAGSGHDFGENNSDLYVAMGDSITRGLGASTTYPSILSGLLGKRVVNLGSDGAKSSAGASSVGSVLRNYKPGYLLIDYGANDIINSLGSGTVINNLRIMIQAAKASKTIPVVATCTPMMYGHILYDGGIIQLNGLIRSLAAEEGAILVDLEQAFEGHPEYMQADGLHPNNSGLNAMALAFFDAL